MSATDGLLHGGPRMTTELPATDGLHKSGTTLARTNTGQAKLSCLFRDVVSLNMKS